MDDAGFGQVDTTAPQALTASAREKLKQVISRIEKLEQEKAGIAADIKDVYAEAKAVGYDTKAIRQVVRLRRIERQEREEMEQILDLYMHAIGEV